VTRDTSFGDYVLEQLAGFHGAAARRMFGGFGLFRGGVMFGLISADELYFKVGVANQPDYEAAKSRPFVYQARGKRVSLSYWRVPDDILEDADDLRAWATKAYAVALETAKKSPVTKPRRTGVVRKTRR
jgi:DNA transformation protein